MTAEPSTEREFCCAVMNAEDLSDADKIRLLHSSAHHYWSLLLEINQRVGELVAEAKG